MQFFRKSLAPRQNQGIWSLVIKFLTIVLETCSLKTNGKANDTFVTITFSLRKKKSTHVYTCMRKVGEHSQVSISWQYSLLDILKNDENAEWCTWKWWILLYTFNKNIFLILRKYVHGNQSLIPMRELWSSPKVGNFKVNFDIAIRDHFLVQATVRRNSHGTIIKSLYQFSPHCDPACSEAQAAFLAVSLATSLKLDNFVLEGVSSLVISYLQQHSIVLD